MAIFKGQPSFAEMRGGRWGWPKGRPRKKGVGSIGAALSPALKKLDAGVQKNPIVGASLDGGDGSVMRLTETVVGESSGASGEEVTQAMLDFFSSGRMLKSINTTVVHLLPKVPNLNRGLLHGYDRVGISLRCTAKLDIQKVYDSVG
ncbi:hypothetical protein Dimus_009312 [Dionaea muscipula]